MNKYVVEIVEKVVYKVERSAVSPECAENLVRELYDMVLLKEKASQKAYLLMQNPNNKQQKVTF